MAKKLVKNSRPSMNSAEAEVINTALMSRQALIEQFLDGTGKDINKECGYPSTLAIETYKALYDREGIAARVIDVYPTESWQEDPEVVEDMEGDKSVFEEAWDELCESMNIYHYLSLIDELSGIGRYGVLFLGIDDGLDFNQPVAGLDQKGNPVGTAAGKLAYMRAFDESVVTIKKLETDKKNPRFGKPTMYTITFVAADGNAASMHDVHWHRVIHVADNRVNSEVYGRPRMQNVFNRLYDLRKVLGGSGEMFWKGGFPGLSMEINPDMTDVDFDEESIKAQVQKYDRGLQRYLALQGVTAKSLSVQVADPSKHIESALRAIAITLGVPFRIFLGSEQAQLASSQDSKSWNRRLRKRQQKYVAPFIIRPFVERLIAFGVLPTPAEGRFHVSWCDLGAPTDEEKAAIGKSRTEALTAYTSSGLSTLIPPMEYFTLVLGYDEEDAEAIIAASESFEDFQSPELAAAEESQTTAQQHAADMKASDQKHGAAMQDKTLKAKAAVPPGKKKVVKNVAQRQKLRLKMRGTMKQGA